MQRISILLNKIADLTRKGDKIDLIEVDLMLDYTRVLYADLSELRNKKVYNTNTITNDATADAAISMATEQPSATEKSEESKPMSQANSTVNRQQKNIKQYIGINDKYQFISELFDNDTSAYDEIITKINTFNTGQKALEWLDEEVANQRNWNEENDSVKMFYDTVSNFFASI